MCDVTVEILSDNVKVGKVIVNIDDDELDGNLSEIAATAFASLSFRVGDVVITQAEIDEWWA